MISRYTVNDVKIATLAPPYNLSARLELIFSASPSQRRYDIRKPQEVNFIIGVTLNEHVGFIMRLARKRTLPPFRGIKSTCPGHNL